MPEIVSTQDPIHWRDDAAKHAAGFLRNGKHEIDDLFGNGYAASHPELLGAYMRTCSENLTSIQQIVLLQDALTAVECCLDAASDAIRKS